MKNRQVTQWIGVLGLPLLALIVFYSVSFNNPRSISKESPVAPAPSTLIATRGAAGEYDSPQREVLDIPELPPVSYPPGSVGEACGVISLPPSVGFHSWYLSQDPYMKQKIDNITEAPLQKKECLIALERHINPINPYLWGSRDTTEGFSTPAFLFIVIDNPLTFERIFTDPAGDFARVQEAFTRPECQLGHDAESNWELNAPCHADAILNYALLTRFCYQEYEAKWMSNTHETNGVSNRYLQIYHKKDNPTPEQDRSMWIQDLEKDWVRQKCDTLDPNLDLQLPKHNELRKKIRALYVEEQPFPELDKTLNVVLIELAARLGDEAAGLTQPFTPSRRSHTFGEEGYKYGPFADWAGWGTKTGTDMLMKTTLFHKYPPSVNRLRKLIRVFSEKTNGHADHPIRFNHNAFVQHLCDPPFFNYNSKDEPPSCRTIVNKLRQEAHSPSMLEAIDTFEDVAIRLDVYEKPLKKPSQIERNNTR
ncbi:MAG: hypothetical protein F4166_09640 [Gammaproteobacteria bacterium]|nr:hypothetical protein [Gammaproteobacteria bacterium]